MIGEKGAMLFSPVTSLGASSLLASSGTTASQLYIEAVTQVHALGAAHDAIGVQQLVPPMSQLTNGLIEMNMPEDVIKNAEMIRDNLLLAYTTNPATQIALNTFLNDLYLYELLPRQNEPAEEALDRLFRQTKLWSPPWQQLRHSTLVGIGHLRSRKGIRFGKTRTEVEATEPEQVVISSDDTSQEIPTREDPIPFRISGRDEIQYQLTDVLGEGGGGLVYEAYDVKMDRFVAIKVINKTGENAAEHMEYFRNEARLQGRMEDENRRIVVIHDTGKSEAGEPFIIMERMHGNLMEHIEEINDGQIEFDLETIITLALQATAAVDEAHTIGIVHKDIKPENFFMVRSKEARSLKFGDFGIAQTIEQISQQKTKNVQGTPPYMPMEAWLEQHPDDYTRDVYSLGVLLFELLTGQLPYDHRKNHISQYLDKSQIDPPRPSQVSPDREIPAELDRIVLKAMSRDIDARYPNAEALLVDLSTYKARAHEQAAAQAETEYLKILRRKEPDKELAAEHKLEWKHHQQRALQEYKDAYKLYPKGAILQEIVNRISDLVKWADMRGNEGERQSLIREWERYEPKSMQLPMLSRRISIQLDFDGADPNDSNYTVSIGHSQDVHGVLKWQGYQETTRGIPQNIIKVPRGNSHYLMVDHPLYHPIGVPVPARPSSSPHTLRIPRYHRESLPLDGIVVPAGPVAVRDFRSRFSEKIPKKDLRIVPYDYWLGPKVTNKDYLKFLIATRRLINRRKRKNRQQALAAFANAIPAHWHEDVHMALLNGQFNQSLTLRDRNDRPLIENAAVTGVGYAHAVHYLRYAYSDFIKKYGYTVLPADLNEWKRAMRGNDRRIYPWGDDTRRGIAVWRFPGFKVPARIPTNDFDGFFDNYPMLDFSPFSIMGEMGPEQAVRFMVSGVRTLLRVDGSSAANMLLDYSGLEYVKTDNPFDHWYFTAGAPYNSFTPKDLEIAQPIPVHDTSALALVGFNPVIKLRTAEQGAVPTPMVSTLTR